MLTPTQVLNILREPTACSKEMRKAVIKEAIKYLDEIAENEQANPADPNICSTCDGSGEIPCPDGFAICRECWGRPTTNIASRPCRR